MTIRSRIFSVALFLAAVLFGWAGGEPAALGQIQDRGVPRQEYFFAMSPFYEGEYETALKAFRSAARSGVRSTEGRWIDSICYYTMMGECYYHMGQPALAMEQYDAALKLFVVYRDWMLRVQFPDTIQPSSRGDRNAIQWAVSKRNSVLGNFPETMLSFQGRINNEDVIRHGGVVEPPQMVSVRAQEIVRCTVLSMRRRRELLGPVCEHDPFTDQILQATIGRRTPPNHWSQTWGDVQRGMAYAAAGKRTEATADLRRALLVGGRFDHPLTGEALLELGKLALEQDQLPAAGDYFIEATLAGAEFYQGDVVEEAFQHALLVHQLTNQNGFFQPLLTAASWAKLKKFRHLQAMLLALAAENYIAMGDAANATAALAEAGQVINRRDMGEGDVGARLQYQTAALQYLKGNAAAGDQALAAFITYQKTASKRLYQIALTDRLYIANTISLRVAELLFETLLVDPKARDWSLDPMETLSISVIPHTLPMEHWFEAVMKRKAPDKAVYVVDLIRRRRFYESLPMGGRLLALRWVLEAPREQINEIALLQRQDLLLRFPEYAQLAQRSEALRQTLRQPPAAGVDPNQFQQDQKKLLQQLAEVGTAQEILLRRMALGRNPSEYVFPPARELKDIQAELAPNQIVLAYFATPRYVFAFLISHDKYGYWHVTSPADVKKHAAAMLQGLGNLEKNQTLTPEVLLSDEWKQPAAETLKALVSPQNFGFWNQFDELIIVPDGLLWLVPFEALQVPEGAATVSLFSKARIRYAPTVSLAVPGSQKTQRISKTTVVMGQLYPRTDPLVLQDVWEQLQRAVPEIEQVPATPAGPSSYLASSWDRLVVLDDIGESGTSPYDWAPGRFDQGKPGSRLSDWFSLPWQGPAEVILPGFHTAAESGLKTDATGQEVFLTICGLMSDGARTVLLSRWRTGGQTSYDLVREFVQELPHESASSAWRRSVELVTASELDGQREPRLNLSSAENPIPASSPFFWAGYLLVDTGQQPLPDEQGPLGPAVPDIAPEPEGPAAAPAAPEAPAADAP